MFFVIAKLVCALLRADTWLVLALVAVQRQKHCAAQWIKVGTFISVVGLSVFPLGEPLLARIEQTHPANPDLERVEGIIVLGGGGDLDVSRRWGQPELGQGGDRYTSALALARQYQAAVIVFTGALAHCEMR